jgi:hypothetical protein
MSKLRFWDYEWVLMGGSWESRDTHVPLKSADIDWPWDWKKKKPQKFTNGDVIISMEEKGQKGSGPSSIGGLRVQDMLYYLEAEEFTPGATCWFWDGKDLACYPLHQDGQPVTDAKLREERYQEWRGLVESVIEKERQCLVIDRGKKLLPAAGDLEVVRFGGQTWTPNALAYESTRFTVDWSKIASATDASEHLLPFGKSEAGIVLLVADICHQKEALAQAEKHLKEGKISKAAKAVRWLANRLTGMFVTGCQVTPVTGTDAPIAIPSLVDAGYKIDQLLKSPALKPSDAPGLAADPNLGATGAAVLTGIDTTLFGLVGSISQFVLDLELIDQLLTDMYDTTKYPGQWDNPAFQAKYGSWPRARALTTLVCSSGSLVTAGANALGAAKAFADAKHLCNMVSIPYTLVPILSGILGVGYTFRMSIRSEKSRRQTLRLAKLKTKMERCPDKKLKLKDRTERLLGYAMEATYRKHWTGGVQAGASSATAASGAILTVGAMVAGANCWNPVGWGLGIAAFVVGGVLIGYRFYRRVRKEALAAEWGFGKEKYPKELIDAYLEEIKDDAKSLDTFILHSILVTFGLSFVTVISKRGESEAAIERQITWT